MARMTRKSTEPPTADKIIIGVSPIVVCPVGGVKLKGG